MISLPACSTDTVTEQWVWLTNRVGHWLGQPSGVIAVAAVLALVALLALRQRQTRQWAVGLGLGAVIGVLLLPLVGNYLLFSLLPPDAGAAADAIVVLGRGPQLRSSRTNVVTDLIQAGRAPLIFASGKSDAPPMLAAFEAQNLDDIALLDGENCSRTTAENAQFTALVLQPRGIEQIILVTDPPHLLRAYLTFRSAGFEVIPHASPFPPEYSHYRAQVLGGREAIGFITYALLGRYW